MVNFADAEPQLEDAAVRPHSPLPPSTMSRRTTFLSSNRQRSLSDTVSVRASSRNQRRFSSLSYSSSEGGSLLNLASSARSRRASSFRSYSYSQAGSTPDMYISPVSDSEEQKPEKDWDEEEKQEERIPVEECAADHKAIDVNQESRSRMYSDETDVDDETIRDSMSKRRAPSTMDTEPRQRYICGRALPLWCTTKPKATAVATFLAKHAPCFWFSRESLSLTTTNQAILLRLNSLTAFFALLQITNASFLSFVLFDKNLLDRQAQNVDRGRAQELVNTPNMWSLNGIILFGGCLGICTFFCMLCSRQSLREIDLPGSLRFMWVLLWIAPIQVYLFVSMFDFHKVTEVWVKHWWSASATAWFRFKSCAPGTYNTLCVVPIDGLPLFSSEDKWCDFYYHSTSCASIRNSAQAQTTRFCYFFYTANGVLGIIVFLLLVLMVKVLEEVITRPIMQKSRERNIPMWLLLPIIGCAVVGSVLLFSPSSILKITDEPTSNSWPGILFLVAAVLYTFAALLGYCISRFAILNARDKRTKRFMVILYIFVLLLTLISVAVLFVGSVLLSARYVGTTIDYELRGALACSISAGSCSYCNNDSGLTECPEWSEADVTKVLKTQLKASATIAALFMVYSLGALRFGFTLQHHISMYQIDYV